jgi:hypothetical protein
MKLPPDSLIAATKIHDYLLKRRDVDDKSKFLSLAGYDATQATRLEADIRALLRFDAEPIETTEYVEKFAIVGVLTGPNGRQLHVRTIWAKLLTTGEARFVTLYPERPRA